MPTSGVGLNFELCTCVCVCVCVRVCVCVSECKCGCVYCTCLSAWGRSADDMYLILYNSSLFLIYSQEEDCCLGQCDEAQPALH